MKRVPLLLIGILVGASGFCSLVYQVVWDRTVRSNFGGDSVSSAIVTGTFLLGLGLGAFAFGRVRRRAFRTYALIEAGVGAYAFVSWHLIAPLAVGLGRLFRQTPADVEGLRLVVVAACVAFLLPPCVLMGGTLPLMFRCFIRPGAFSGRAIGLLYGINTLGAAMGIFIVPTVFLNYISIPATLRIVGAINLILGAVLWRLGVGRDMEIDAAPAHGPPALSLAAVAFFSGFITLAYEISVLRAFMLPNQFLAYVFPAVLMPFLLALSIGSVAGTKRLREDRASILGRIGLLLALSAAAMAAGVAYSSARVGAGYNVSILSKNWEFAAYAIALAFLMPLCMGGVFPLTLRAASGGAEDLPRVTGGIYLANAAGMFAGAMGAQFLGFPLLGARAVMVSLIVVCAAAGAAAAWRSGGIRCAAAAVAIASVVGVACISPRQWDFFVYGRSGRHIDRVQGVTGVALVDWNAARTQGGVYVNGTFMSALPLHPLHAGLAAVALSLPQPRRVLILGLGGGNVLRELARDTGIRELHVVDWSYELPRLLRSPRAALSLDHALDDPRVRLYRCDARVLVSLFESNTFDLAVDNLARTNWAGATNVKSIQYFTQIDRILKPGGAFVYDLNCATPDACLATKAGLLRAFRHMAAYEGFVVASDAPVRWDAERMARAGRTLGPKFLIGPVTPDWLLSKQVFLYRSDFAGIAPIRDEAPVHEYYLYPVTSLLRKLHLGFNSK